MEANMETGALFGDHIGTAIWIHSSTPCPHQNHSLETVFPDASLFPFLHPHPNIQSTVNPKP